MTGVLAFWTHALAAAVFATLFLWQLRGGTRGAGQQWLLAGLAMTAIWAWSCAVAPGSVLAANAETARNLLWIALLSALSATDDDEEPQLRGVRLVYAAVAAGLAMQLIVDTLPLWVPEQDSAVAATSLVLRMTTAAGSLVLVHNLYGQAAPASRTSIRLAMAALAMGWVYDLNLYTVAYLGGVPAPALFAWRGAMLLATAPLFALGGLRADGWRIRLSRAATFQSLSLLAICSYLALTAVLASVLRGTHWDWARGLTVGLLSAMTIAVVVLLPSARARSWTKVKIVKHFFEHRYDYRTEWLRFTATLGGDGQHGAPLPERVVKAFADIVDAPAGLLLAANDEQSPPTLAAAWNWNSTVPTAGQLDETGGAMWAALGTGRVLELDAHRRGIGASSDLAVPIPAWLKNEGKHWVGIPLIHGERLVGLVLLAAPEVRRALDWEDFDLLRTAGRQAASSLAEAHGQQALMNAQRFDEFNRRFAFILHDVKNLVSQLSLLTRNAERHADNPEFRADMVGTLKSSVGKLNDLLTRLAPKGDTLHAPPSRTFSLLIVLSAAIAAKRSQHDVRLLGPAALQVMGHAGSLEQTVGHLLQNAIDASASDAPVLVRVAVDGARVSIEITDRGCGMDPDFIRNRLFQPFASTKEGGFGIGAFEARSLVHAMGGQLSVASQLGEGTRFTIHLPAAVPVEVSAAQTRKIA